MSAMWRARRSIYVIADATQVHAEFYVYPRDAERLRAGQPITVRELQRRSQRAAPTIEAILPTADMLTQTVVAHVDLPNAGWRAWRPGQAVRATAWCASHEAPLAVRTRALQRFRDFTVVFARVGETYEVRMLELGRRIAGMDRSAWRDRARRSLRQRQRLPHPRRRRKVRREPRSLRAQRSCSTASSIFRSATAGSCWRLVLALAGAGRLELPAPADRRDARHHQRPGADQHRSGGLFAA